VAWRLFLVVLVVLVVQVGVHELSHVAVFHNHGCSYGFAVNSYGIVTEGFCVGLSVDRSDDVDLANSFVDGVGYQLFIPLVLLSLLVFKELG